VCNATWGVSRQSVKDQLPIERGHVVRDSVPGCDRRRVVGLFVVGLALCTAACGVKSSATPGNVTRGTSPSTMPTRSAPALPTSPVDRAKQQALDAYSGMWHAMADAGVTSDWQSPKLEQYATGDALGVISRLLYTDHLNGVVTKGEPKLHPQVTSVDPPNDPTTVMISDCGDDSGWLKYKTNGQLVDDIPGGRRTIIAEVQKQQDGSWKGTRFAVGDTGTC
jgi:hypothetical protein